MTRSRLRWTFLAVSLAVAPFAAFPQIRYMSRRPEQTAALVDEAAPTAAELSAKETVASAFLRSLDDEEYELRSAAEFMPADKYGYRPAQGDYGGVYPGYGPKELRTFAEQINHVACANFAFSAELDSKTPPPGCDKGGPSPAKTRDELVSYLRDSFNALRKSLSAVTQKTIFDPIEAPTPRPKQHLGTPTFPPLHASATTRHLA